MLQRNMLEIPREVNLFLTILYGLLFKAVLVLARKLRRSDVPERGVPDFYLPVGAVVVVGVGFPLYGLARILLG